MDVEELLRVLEGVDDDEEFSESDSLPEEDLGVHLLHVLKKKKANKIQMCTNRALVDSLECYMDDLVDAFEDFVKKSLILISVGLAAVVAMFVYILKVLTDRSGTSSAAVDTNEQNLRRCRNNTSIENSANRNNIKSDFLLSCDPNLVCSSANTVPTVSSFDERFLNEIGYTNYKTCELKPRIQQSCSAPKISVPSLPTCLPKQHLPPPRNSVKALKRTSCCSMCCDDNKSNI